MAADPVITGLLFILVVIALVTLVLALRHRLSFRIAMRNVRRGRGRTVLLIAGLLVATTIVAGSLVVGSTVNQLVLHYTYLGTGYDDEAIGGTAATPNQGYFPYSTYTQTGSLLASDRSIAEIAPEIIGTVAVLDRTSQTPDTNLNLIGVNGNQSTALGAFIADNGTSIIGPGPGQALIDDQTASALNASVGDSIAVYGTTYTPVVLTVEAIVQENLRGAFITAGLTAGNVFVNLAASQAIENESGMINYISITNTGSQAAGAVASTGIAASLNVTLASVLAPDHLAVSTPLESGLTSASTSGQSLETLFLALGLFSILAGAMLIVGIFVMLAEERKGEMGMLRAIGMRRSDLVYTYYFEGVAYAAGSALAGTFVGIGVGYLLTSLAGTILSADGIPQGALTQSFTVTGDDIVIAYVVGFILTLVTVIVASYRASRLNIVRAIRDVPEPRPPIRTYTYLAYVGAVVVLLGALFYRATYQGTSDISYPLIAGAMVIAGLGLIASRFVKNRYAFTAVGAALAVWTGTESLHVALFGTAHSSTIFIVFVEGILLVGGVLLVVLMNGDLIARALRGIGGSRIQSSPVVRVGTDYPARQPGRTAVTLAIFALVIFTMIAIAAAGSTVQGSLNTAVAEESGGYSFFGYSTTPIPDMWTDISSNATLAPMFVNAVPLVIGSIHVNVSGYAANPYSDSIYAAPGNVTADANFYATNQFTFVATDGGMSAAATFQELETNPSVAVVDEGYAHLANSFSTSAPTHPKLNVGNSIEVSTAAGTHPTNLTVIGILTESIITGVFVNPTTAASMGFHNESAYFLTVAHGVSTTAASRAALREFFPEGIVLFDLSALLATSIATTEGFIGLLEIFVGLGLGVGIAAMGIFALRAVVERRREIGMLRATGFTRGMVLRAFFLEYSFVTLLGIAIGVSLGLLVVYNLSIGPTASTEGVQNFVAPWVTVIEVAVIAYLLVLVAIALPSLRAARMPPAEAVRTTE
ncbi:MAG: FtsX-like permease family protein [Thermoplasmata archaeon]